MSVVKSYANELGLVITGTPFNIASIAGPDDQFITQCVFSNNCGKSTLSISFTDFGCDINVSGW